MQVLRTPDDQFNHLEGYNFQPHYIEVPALSTDDQQTLRMHYVDEGPRDSTTTILCLHGEPSWSYLYRHMIPLLVAKGYRVIAPDLVGFGKSDKPTPRGEYTYARHEGWLRSFVEAMDLQKVVIFCQDWGGLLGIRVAALLSHRIAGLVVSNTGIPTGTGANAAFRQWLDFSQNAPQLPISSIIAGGTATTLSRGAQAAYDAPFPDETYKEGARMFPALVPMTPGVHADINKRMWSLLARVPFPIVTCFGDADPVSAGGDAPFQQLPAAKGQPHTVVKGGGHFIQEDCPKQLVDIIAALVNRNKARL